MMGIYIDSCQIGFNVTANGGGKGADHTQGVGSMLVVDSSIQNVPVAILSAAPMTTNLTSLMLENLMIKNIEKTVQDMSGHTLLSGCSTTISTWGLETYTVPVQALLDFKQADI